MGRHRFGHGFGVSANDDASGTGGGGAFGDPDDHRFAANVGKRFAGKPRRRHPGRDKDDGIHEKP
jgi:hypothetical protein